MRFLLGVAMAAVAAVAVAGASGFSGNGTTVDSSSTAVATPAILAPPDLIVGEGDDFVDVAVRLSAPGLSEVQVTYATAGVSASAGFACNGDFVPGNGTLVFAPGETTKLVRLDILDCAGAEPFETFTLGLSAAVNGVIARAASLAGIVDNDTVAATPRLFVRDAVVDERDGIAFVSVLLGGPAGQASNSTVTVGYSTSDGTADGDDYAAVNGTLTFSPGETAKTVAVAITDDAAAEPVESFTLGLSGPSGASIADGSGVVTIGASDAGSSAQPAILAPADVVVGEGEGFVDLAVRLSVPGSEEVQVDYATAGVSGSAGFACNGDFAPANGTLVFAPGETTKVVRVQVLHCAAVEPFETFRFGLSSAVNGAIARAAGLVGIVDADTVVATPRLFVRDAALDERDGFALVSVLLGGPAGQASNSTVTVAYATADGTAGGADYTGTAGTLVFAPGETAKTVVVPIADDAAVEPVESFSLGLSAPTGATVSDGSGLVTIGGSDAGDTSQPAIFAPVDLVVGEGDGFLDVVVRLSVPGSEEVQVDYATAGVSGSAGFACNGDFAPSNGTLVFAPGETTKVVRVQVLHCVGVEPFETFTLGLSAAVNGVIARAASLFGIVDADTVVATPRLFVRDAVVDERDGFALVSVLLGGPAGQASNSTVTVAYATADGTAGGADYTGTAGTLAFAPGETAKTVAVPISDDGVLEGVESLSLGLSGATNATISDGSGVVTIGASDAGSSAQPAILAPADVVVGEGDGFIDVAVRLSAPGSEEVQVNYATAGVTGSAGFACNGDFVPGNGTLTFAPGETTKVVRVQVLHCVGVELFETFRFGLSSAVSGTIARAAALIGIVDADTVVATPRLFVRDAVVDERDGFALVSVLLGGPAGQASNSTVTVGYATADGTAGGADYTGTAGTLVFAPGETAKTVVVAIAGDGANEPAEGFTLGVSNPVGTTIAHASGAVTISASDAAASAQSAILAPLDVVVGEGDGFLDLAVRLSLPSLQEVSVNYATAGVTASAGFACNGDFAPGSGTLTFAPGETTKVVRAQLLDCAGVEVFETFAFNLSVPVHGVISRASGLVGIVDDDSLNPDTGVFGPTGTYVRSSADYAVGSSVYGSQFECRANGAPFTPCTSPHTVSNLLPGRWVLEFRASAELPGAAIVTPDASPAVRELRVVQPFVVDWDANGKANVNVWRPSSGGWLVQGSPNAFFGLNGDVPVPGQWDADAALDRAVWRPVSGGWYVQGSAATYFGASNDLPVPGQWDADPELDKAVWRPVSGGWYVQGSPTSFFGRAGDVPVPGDYDADAALDKAVFRPSNGAWFVEGSPTVFHGQNGDIPIPADWNGDGKTDIAVFRPANATWYLRGISTTAFGAAGDVPMAGDFDADPAVDKVLFRPTTGAWYVDTATPFTFFGVASDIP